MNKSGGGGGGHLRERTGRHRKYKCRLVNFRGLAAAEEAPDKEKSGSHKLSDQRQQRQPVSIVKLTFRACTSKLDV